MPGLGFYLGNFFIAYYGLCILLGVGAALLVGRLRARRRGLPFDDLLILAAVCGLCGIVGAKLLYLAVSRREIAWDRLLEPDYFSALMSGGFVFYGGLFGGLAGLLFCAKRLKIPVAAYLGAALPGVPLFPVQAAEAAAELLIAAALFVVCDRAGGKRALCWYAALYRPMTSDNMPRTRDAIPIIENSSAVLPTMRHFLPNPVNRRVRSYALPSW